MTLNEKQFSSSAPAYKKANFSQLVISVISRSLSSFAVLALVGCDRHSAVGGGFELVSGQGFGPDSHPGTRLAYQGKCVWQNVDLHTFVTERDTTRFVHGDCFVFLLSIPGDDKDHYNYSISPQLAVIRGSGPPVVLSERITGHAIANNEDGVVCRMVPSAAGVHVEFGPSADGTRPASSVHDITWQQIAAWLDAPESEAPKIVKPLGTYRLLRPEQRR
jgi:hypothetical protein